MDFKAEHQRIRAFGVHVRNLGDDANDAKTYTVRHFNPTVRYDMSRMFLTLAQAAEKVVEALVPNYNHLAVVAMESGAALEKAADLYRRTDRLSSRRIDASGHKPPVR